MTHLSHGETWQNFDRNYTDLEFDSRNIRLGIWVNGLLLAINLLNHILVGLWLLLLIIFCLKCE